MKIAITGATGFVGSRLVERLLENKQEVVILTRNPLKAKKMFPSAQVVGYQPKESGDWQTAINGCDGVVNLAGEAIAERWTPQHKEEILASRQLGTQKLVEAIKKASNPPQVLISASAIGYYGSNDTATLDETSPMGNDFLAQVCQKWEAAAQEAIQAGVRLVIVRIGIVLGQGGALGKMIGPFQMFAGGPIGTGKQWFSWIHREDLVQIIWSSLQDSRIEGVINGTAPNPVRMSELCQTLGEVLHRPSWLPVPPIALELLLGEGAKVVLEGQQVIPKRTQALGFTYQYPQLKSALEEIL